MEKIQPNATLVERIQHYVENDLHEQARALAQVGDYLEECFLWDIEFNTEGL